MSRNHPLNSPKAKIHLVPTLARGTRAACGAEMTWTLRATKDQNQVTCQRCLAAASRATDSWDDSGDREFSPVQHEMHRVSRRVS